MTRKKDSVALFEVISKARPGRQQQTGIDVPNWMGRKDASGDAAGESSDQRDAEASAAEAEQGAPSGAPSAPSRSPALPKRAATRTGAAPTGSAAMPGSEPTLARVGDRIRLSVTDVTAAVVAAGLVGLLVLAFLVGRWTKGSDDGPAEAGLAQTTDKADDADGKTGDTQNGGAQTPVRQAGKYYLVIQNLGTYRPDTSDGRDKEEAARRIKAWLDERGLGATLNTGQAGGRKQLIVWSTRAFDSPRDEAALSFAREIQELGREYLRSGGRYNFLQERNGEFDPMFLRAR
ncbi:MAG: hypothetical protein ACOC8F_01905 [Planctomycetota bacterium]